jgi:hypothetical protein
MTSDNGSGDSDGLEFLQAVCDACLEVRTGSI